MKQNDMVTLMVVIFISAILSIGIGKLIFSSASESQTVEVVRPVSSAFSEPDKRFFNDQSINPTRVITIGNNTNPDPFSASQQ